MGRAVDGRDGIHSGPVGPTAISRVSAQEARGQRPDAQGDCPDLPAAGQAPEAHASAADADPWCAANTENRRLSLAELQRGQRAPLPPWEVSNSKECPQPGQSYS